MTQGCRIGRVKMKDGGADLKIFRGKEAGSFDGFFNRAKEAADGAIACGYFIVYKDRTGYRQYGWDTGATLSDFLGGAESLTDFIKSKEGF